MSEVIVRMEMPRNCLFCPMSHWNKIDKLTGCDAVDGKQHVPKDDEFWEADIPSWCPITGELPEQHGRLVDADSVALAMVEKGQGSSRYKWGEMWELNGLEIREALQTVSTIVPATERSET